ncbi:MAG: hypothetical protein OXT71_17180 [Acidobacteriota bacterium]|nr:hypothetical protein [Acidobacteriota bacterium]
MQGFQPELKVESFVSDEKMRLVGVNIGITYGEDELKHPLFLDIFLTLEEAIDWAKTLTDAANRLSETTSKRDMTT